MKARQIITRTVLAAGAAGGITALALAGAVPAGASLNPTQVITPNGQAGYSSTMNDPGHYTRIKDTFYLRQALEGQGPAGAAGIQLCNESSGNAVQLAVRWDSGISRFRVLLGSGTLTENPGTNTTACNSGGGAALESDLTPVLTIPQGQTIKLVLQEIHPGFYEAFAKNMTTGVNVSKSFSGLTFPDEAFAGLVQKDDTLSPPATTKLARMTDIGLIDSTGTNSTLADGSAWDTNQVRATANGLNSDGSLVTPASSLSGPAFSVFEGGNVG